MISIYYMSKEVVQIWGLDVEVEPEKGNVLPAEALSIGRPDNCVAGCEGGSLPSGCPVTGELLKGRWPIIITAASEIDRQLPNATCVIINPELIKQKFRSSQGPQG